MWPGFGPAYHEPDVGGEPVVAEHVTWKHSCGAMATALVDGYEHPPSKCGKCHS